MATRIDSIGNVPHHIKSAVELQVARKKLRKPPPAGLYKYLFVNYGNHLKETIVAEWKRLAEEHLIKILPHIQSLVAVENPQGMRKDAWPDTIDDHIADLREKYDLLADQSRALATGTFNAVDGLSRRQWYKTAKTVLVVDLIHFEPWIVNEAKAFVSENVSLITRTGTDALHDISRIIMTGFRQGRRAESLIDDIMGTDLTPGVFDKVETRAALIARDQTSKLYGTLTKKRQENAGLLWYVWRTAEDERVRGDPGGNYPDARPSHFCLNGKVCRWDDATVYADSVEEAKKGNWKARKNMPEGPGVELHPGEDINCRCYAEGVFDTLFMDPEEVKQDSRIDGGAGSGDFHHAGRHGEVGGSARGEGGRSEKAKRALKSHKPATAKVQKIADNMEIQVNKALGGDRTDDNEAFDIIKGHDYIEVKTIVRGKNDKITMHPESLERKLSYTRHHGGRAHTIVVDARRASNNVYYSEGVGSFRLTSMIKLPNLKSLRSFL